MKTIATVITTILALAAGSLHAETRTWTDAESGKTIDGELISIDGEQATLKRSDGKTFTVDISRFIEADQVYIKENGIPAEPSEDSEESAAMDGTENDVTLTGLHLCCGGCEKGIDKALAEMEDIEYAVSRSSDSINITSSKSSAIQDAVDAIAAAGYYGKSNFAEIAIEEVKGTSTEKTDSADISSLHICCGACERAIEETLTAVEGVASVAIDKQARTATVTGDFTTADTVSALQTAGFHPSL
ncbi:MAG: cation transporter [Verrucomicrobiota bacterium]